MLKKSKNLLIVGSLAMVDLNFNKFSKYTSRTSNGRKRTVTAAQQKRESIKRKNKGK